MEKNEGKGGLVAPPKKTYQFKVIATAKLPPIVVIPVEQDGQNVDVHVEVEEVRDGR